MFSPRKKWIYMFSPSISQTNWSWSQPFKASFNHHLAEVRSISFLLLLPEKSNFLISKSTGQNPYHSHSHPGTVPFSEKTPHESSRRLHQNTYRSQAQIRTCEPRKKPDLTFHYTRCLIGILMVFFSINTT